MIVVTHAKALWSKVIWYPQRLQLPQCPPHRWCTEGLDTTNANGESIASQMSTAKFVGMPRGPKHLNAFVSDGSHLWLARQVNADGLACHRHAIFHPRSADGFGSDVEMSTKKIHHLMVSHSFFHDAQVQMLTLAARVVQLQFFYKEVPGTFLDASPIDICKPHQARRRKRGWKYKCRGGEARIGVSHASAPCARRPANICAAVSPV